MMKKNLFFVGMAVAALSSCSNDEVLDVAQSNVDYRAIEFRSVVDYATRAPEALIDNESFKAFNVFGYYQENGGSTVQKPFDATTVSKGESGSWGYTTLNYWMDNSTYKFAGYAPTDFPQPKYDYTTEKMTFTDVDIHGNQKDLIVSGTTTKTVNLTSTPEGPGMVDMNFKHALSMVKFTLKDGFRNDVIVTIKNFKFNGAVTTGTLVTNNDIQTIVGTWTPGTTKKEFDEGNTENVLDDNNATYEPEYYIIPQTISADQVKISFDVSVQNPDGSIVNIGEGMDAETGVRNVEVVVPVTGIENAVGEWKSGNRYNYVLTLDGNTFNLKVIQFGNITVSEWLQDYDDPAGTIDQGNQFLN